MKKQDFHMMVLEEQHHHLYNQIMRHYEWRRNFYAGGLLDLYEICPQLKYLTNLTFR